VQTELQADHTLLERAGYFPVSGAHLYTVLHEVPDPLARVLLVGPFASERHFSYHPWVRWARYLAAKGIEVLRYDYRGIGESTGAFEEMTFSHWKEDVALLAEWFSGRSRGIPLLLHGLEIGALIAGTSFDHGVGDGLLLWSPPSNANQSLRASLLRWAGLEQLFESPENRRSATYFIRQLEEGASVEVSGYEWTSALWKSSFGFHLPAHLSDEARACAIYKRPVRITKLGRETAPLVKPYVGYDEVKELTWLYDSTFEWVSEAICKSK
jgi:hypothetical protein